MCSVVELGVCLSVLLVVWGGSCEGLLECPPRPVVVELLLVNMGDYYTAAAAMVPVNCCCFLHEFPRRLGIEFVSLVCQL